MSSRYALLLVWFVTQTEALHRLRVKMRHFVVSKASPNSVRDKDINIYSFLCLFFN